MYDLIKINETDYYIDYPAKIGVIKTSDNEVVLIDGGNDKNAGKRILKTIEENGLKITAIFNTHSHADHIGGNRYIQEKTGCKCYAFGTEVDFSNLPEVEAMVLYGANPTKELKNKFLLAEKSEVLPITEDVLPDGMSVINLPGHTESMVGFLTKNKTAFIADVVSREEILEKYGVCYLWDYKKSIETLEYIKTLDADVFVPAHAEVTTDISALADYNIKCILEIEAFLLSLCENPIRFDDILKKVFDRFSLSMSMQQYALVGSTVRSYLTKMYESGKIKFKFENNYMLWEKI